MAEQWADQIREGADRMGLDISAQETERLSLFLSELYARNEAVNLTRVPPNDAAETHILDCLSLLLIPGLPKVRRALDVGTGGGLPGVPLAVLRPGWQWTLMDGTRKKLDFVSHAAGVMGLRNVTVLHGRAEEAARRPELTQSFDLVAARAVASMDRLVEWMLPFVRPGGVAVAYKTKAAAQEIADCVGRARMLGGELTDVVPIRLPFSGAERLLAVLRRRMNSEESTGGD